MISIRIIYAIPTRTRVNYKKKKKSLVDIFCCSRVDKYLDLARELNTPQQKKQNKTKNKQKTKKQKKQNNNNK